MLAYELFYDDASGGVVKPCRAAKGDGVPCHPQRETQIGKRWYLLVDICERKARLSDLDGLGFAFSNRRKTLRRLCCSHGVCPPLQKIKTLQAIIGDLPLAMCCTRSTQLRFSWSQPHSSKNDYAPKRDFIAWKPCLMRAMNLSFAACKPARETHRI